MLQAPGQPARTRGRAKPRGVMLAEPVKPSGPAAGVPCPGPASIAQTTPGFCLSTHARPRSPLCLQPLLTTPPPTELCPRPRPRSGSCRPHLPGLDSPAGAWTGLQLPEQPQEPHNVRGGTTARGRCLETRGLRSPTPQTSRTTDPDGGDGLSSPTQTRPPRCAKR